MGIFATQFSNPVINQLLKAAQPVLQHVSVTNTNEKRPKPIFPFSFSFSRKWLHLFLQLSFTLSISLFYFTSLLIHPFLKIELMVEISLLYHHPRLINHNFGKMEFSEEELDATHWSESQHLNNQRNMLEETRECSGSSLYST